MLQQAAFKTETAAFVENQGTRWHFIPPGAPHQGGLWEAAVKAAKHHLKRVIGDSTLTYKELSTLITQVEACLNSRPINAMSSDPQDLTSLTPGYFLIGASLTAVPEPYDGCAARTPTTTRWLQVTRMRNEFWRQWKAEYLQTLQARTKWKDPLANPRLGDLVLVRSESTPPTKWLLARIIKVHPGKDQLVRVMTVRTASSTLTRPIKKICSLPVHHDEEH